MTETGMGSQRYMGGGGAKRRLGFVVVFEGDREEHDGIGRGREWERWGRVGGSKISPVLDDHGPLLTVRG